MKTLWLSSLLLIAAQSALAQSPTLQRIKHANTIKLGYAESAIPFSYWDKDANIARGFGVDLSEKIADTIQKELNLPELKREYVLVNIKNRWELHENGGIDVSCIVMTNTEERQRKNAAFSYSYFSAGARMLVPKALGAKSYRDLAGKVVGVPENSASRGFVVSKRDSFKFKDVSIEPSFNESFERLKKGEIDAVVYDDVSLASILFRNPDIADQFEIIGKPVTEEHYGCTMQRNDPEFKVIVDKVIAELIQTQQLHQLYDKWFIQPIPPSGRSFNFPMSQATEKLFSVPSDKAVGQLD